MPHHHEKLSDEQGNRVVDSLPLIMPIVFGMCGCNDAEAWGEGQDALVDASIKYDAKRGEFEPYAKKCIRTRIIAWRKAKALRKAVPFHTADESDLPRVQVTDDEFHELIAKLPPLTRWAMELKYVEGKSLEAIGKAMETSASTARRMIQQGLNRLKEISSQMDAE